MHRTTVILDDELYREVKRKAVDRGQPMRALMEEALKIHLGLVGKHPKTPPPKFGAYKARVVGPWSRKEIYEEYLARKFR